MKYSDLVQKIRNHSMAIAKSSHESARYRAASYERAAALIETNMVMNKQVSKIAISKLPLTEYMLSKVMDAIDNKLKIADIDQPKNKIADQLAEFPGIGKAIATALIKAGVKNIKQLEQKKYQKMLTNETLLTLKYKPLDRIPRDLIVKFEESLTPLKSKYKWEIVGSYRRKKPTSGDIDLMLIDDNVNVTKNFIEDLSKLGYKFHIYAEGEDRYGVLIKLSDWVRADFFRASEEDAPAMLLYSTGSKEHNVLMRAKAKALGMLLNQRGLFKGKQKININSEKGFFDALGMEYKTPAQR